MSRIHVYFISREQLPRTINTRVCVCMCVRVLFMREATRAAFIALFKILRICRARAEQIKTWAAYGIIIYHCAPLSVPLREMNDASFRDVTMQQNKAADEA